MFEVAALLWASPFIKIVTVVLIVAFIITGILESIDNANRKKYLP